jgi:hypothetical protein
MQLGNIPTHWSSLPHPGTSLQQYTSGEQILVAHVAVARKPLLATFFRTAVEDAVVATYCYEYILVV